MQSCDYVVVSKYDVPQIPCDEIRVPGVRVCACDISNNGDSGYIRDLQYFPIRELHFSDTGGDPEWLYYTLGPLRCVISKLHHCFDSLRPRLNRRPFADDIFKYIFLNENEWILPRISLKFVPKVRINNMLTLVQIMAWRWPGDKPLSEPMMVSLLTHICVTRPQWVKVSSSNYLFPYGPTTSCLCCLSQANLFQIPFFPSMCFFYPWEYNQLHFRGSDCNKSHPERFSLYWEKTLRDYLKYVNFANAVIQK